MADLGTDVRPVAEALFSTASGPPPSTRLDWLCADFEDFAAHAGLRARVILRAGLTAATWLAPPMIRKVPPLGRLSVEDRCRALEALERTPAGLPLLGLKAMLSIIYYEHPDVLRECGVVVPDGVSRAPAGEARSSAP